MQFQFVLFCTCIGNAVIGRDCAFYRRLLSKWSLWQTLMTQIILYLAYPERSASTHFAGVKIQRINHNLLRVYESRQGLLFLVFLFRRLFFDAIFFGVTTLRAPLSRSEPTRRTTFRCMVKSFSRVKVGFVPNRRTSPPK